MELPEKFRTRMEHLLGKDAPAFFRALKEEPQRAFRFDEKKVSREEVEKAFPHGILGEVPFSENALLFDFEGIGNHPYHHGGALYVQEPAAMAPISALGKEKVHTVLDLCAAPGGKSLQAASLLEEGGFLVCNEPSPPRRKVLMQNLERLGEKRALVTSFDGRDLPQEWEEAFDLVICDAPCSGEGMMRKHPDAVRLWSEENIFLCARRQKEILSQGARCVSPGGRLIYSTCTWAVEENEEQVKAFLWQNPDFHLIPPTDEVISASVEGVSSEQYDLRFTRRFYPHIFKGEGQFLAIFRKEAEGGREKKDCPRKERKKKPFKKSETRLLAEEFLSRILVSPPSEEILLRGEEIYLAPRHPFCSTDFVSPGVLVGEERKGRIVPHHRFFLSYASSFSNKVHLSPTDPRVEAYLRGEEIDLCGADGWGVLFCGNTPLGGIKLCGGKGKNHYPKGLRKV